MPFLRSRRYDFSLEALIILWSVSRHLLLVFKHSEPTLTWENLLESPAEKRPCILPAIGLFGTNWEKAIWVLTWSTKWKLWSDGEFFPVSLQATVTRLRDLSAVAHGRRWIETSRLRQTVTKKGLYNLSSWLVQGNYSREVRAELKQGLLT